MKKKIITAGVDEVGRGCLAGPVVSAAVILKEGIDLDLLKDSKKISFKKRLKISDHIQSNSHYAIGLASVEEILDINILGKKIERFMNGAVLRLELDNNGMSCTLVHEGELDPTEKKSDRKYYVTDTSVTVDHFIPEQFPEINNSVSQIYDLHLHVLQALRLLRFLE